MVRRMAMEAFMSKHDASHKARLEVFAKILDLASFEAKFVLKGWDGGDPRDLREEERIYQFTAGRDQWGGG
jgi:hypothetical protein